VGRDGRHLGTAVLLDGRKDAESAFREQSARIECGVHGRIIQFGGPIGFVAMQPPTDKPPIPYAGHHAGPRRVLVLNLHRGLIAGSSVTVNIDGNEYPQRWGRTAFEIPEDRPVAVAVFQKSRGGQAGLATTVLVPGAPPELEYRGPAHLAMAGELGLPGTVRQRGLAMQSVLLGCLGLVLLFLVLFLVFIVTAL
jgi:hypothetical protein